MSIDEQPVTAESFSIRDGWIVRHTPSGDLPIYSTERALERLRDLRCCGQSPLCLRCFDLIEVITGLRLGEQWAAHDALDWLAIGSLRSAS